MLKRKQEREIVYKTLYMAGLQDITAADAMTAMLSNYDADYVGDDVTAGEIAGSAYINDTLSGIDSHVADVDAVIERHAVGWALDRIAPLTLAALRYGVYELTYTDIDVGVIISETVDLAGMYDESAAADFINGILGNYARGDIRKGGEA